VAGVDGVAGEVFFSGGVVGADLCFAGLGCEGFLTGLGC